MFINYFTAYIWKKPEKIMTKTQELELIEDYNIDVDGSSVIVLNDDWHTFEEVIRQLKRAIHCSTQQAEAFAIEIHTKGKAKVYSGTMEDCLFISAVLEEIDLMTSVEA